MNRDEKALLLDQLTVLSEYYGKPLSEAQMTIYVQGLMDLPIADVLNATTALVKTNIHLPRVAEIRNAIVGVVEDVAEFEWNAARSELRRVGYTGKPVLSAATIRAIEQIWGSWIAFCQTLPADGPELLGWAKQFKSTFRISERLALPTNGRLELGE